MKNTGKIFKVINGNYKGKFVVAMDKEQIAHYLKVKRLFVRYFEDEELEKPTMLDGKKMCGLEWLKDLQHVGFIN